MSLTGTSLHSATSPSLLDGANDSGSSRLKTYSVSGLILPYGGPLRKDTEPVGFNLSANSLVTLASSQTSLTAVSSAT